MTAQVIEETTNYERAIIHIVRMLPRERAAQVLDFARFMQIQPPVDQDADMSEPNEDLWGRASIQSLAKYWDTPEEDEAWAHL